MPSCFWNFLSRSLVPDTLRQPTSKHTLTFRETCFFFPPPSAHSAPSLLSSPSLSCWEFNLLDQAPRYRSSTSCLAPDRIVWGILGSSCVDVWLCMWRLVQFWHLLLRCDKVGQRITLHSVLCGSALINNEVTLIYGDIQAHMRGGLQTFKESSRKFKRQVLISCGAQHFRVCSANICSPSSFSSLGLQIAGTCGQFFSETANICLSSLQDVLAPYWLYVLARLL